MSEEYTELFNDPSIDVNNRTDELVHLIKYHRNLYYNDTSVISDEEFDAYVDELRELDPSHKVLFEVGSNTPDDSPWKTGRHGIAMTSLDKVNSKEEIRDWVRKRNVKWLCPQEKLDGFSCFDGDTKIWLANGETVPIRDLVEENTPTQILSWNQDKGIHISEAIHFIDNGLKDNWIKLTFEDGSTVSVTEEHLFFVEGEGWIEAKHLLNKDIKQF